MNAVEIICNQCKKESFLHREAIYEGFSKVGEKLSCASCGFVYSSENEVPFKKAAPKKQLFTEEDIPEKVTVFEEGENRKICRYCHYYVVNPFTQFCSAHTKEVQATDSCNRFKTAEKSDASTDVF